MWQFRKFVPSVILPSEISRNYATRRRSANLTVGNFSKAVEESGFMAVESLDTSHLPSQMNNNQGNDSWNREECATNKECLSNMYRDCKSMPSCSEKSVISLMYYVSLKLTGGAEVLDPNFPVPDRIETEIDKEYSCLKERLKAEESLSSEIQNALKELLTYLRNENWKDSMSLLRTIFKKISPLNIHELFRLVEKVDNAAQLIRDREIIFFLGVSGSGKSTTIHFLAGSEMIQTTVNGLTHIAPHEVRNPDLRNVTTSPFAQSETRYITPVTVNIQDVGGFNSGSIILCDSPGFEDTNGPEVDIANGIGIVKAIRGCQSVKPVVLISYRSIGDNFQGLKSLTHLLAGFIPGIQDQIRAFSYLFTRYPEAERNTIHASLVDINQRLNDEERADGGFMNLFRDMLRKTRDRTRVLDPVNDEPGVILDELVESRSIRNPDEVFQFSITENSKIIVHEQVRRHQLSIMSATERSEYSLIKYKLDQLKRLNDLLNLNYIEQIYSDCVRYISQHLSTKYEEGTSTLKRCLMNQTVLTNEDIEQYQTYIDHAKEADELRSEHLGREVVHSSAFAQYVKEQVNIMRINFEEKDIDDSSVKTDLDKIKLLIKFSNDIDVIYKTSCELFARKVDCTVELFERSMSPNEFDSSVTCMTKLSDACHVLQDHFERTNMETKYQKMKEYFLNYLSGSVKKLNDVFAQERLGTGDIERLNGCVSMLETAMNTYALQTHISKEDVKKIYDDLLSKILEYFEEILRKINREFENDDGFKNLEQLIKELDVIRTISTIAHRTSQTYYSTLEKLIGYINESRKRAEELLRVMFRREGNVDYHTLTRCLSNLRNAHWIEKYRAGIYSNIENNVKQQIIQHIEQLKRIVMRFDLNLDNSDKVTDVYKIVSEINEMKPINVFLPTIDEHISEVNSWFFKITKAVFDNIKDTFGLERRKEQEYKSLDPDKAEKAFHYLDICREIPMLLESECRSVLNSLEDFIRCYSNFIQTEMRDCFDKVVQNQCENRRDMLTKAQIISNRLNEICNVRTNSSRVFSFFSTRTIVDDWKNDLSNYLIELSAEMRQLSVTNRIESLNTKLLIAQALSRLDRFLEGEKYSDIYRRYENACGERLHNAVEQVIDAIRTFDFERIAHLMILLQSSPDDQHFYREAKRPLNAGLDQLMEETRNQAIMLSSNITREEVRCIVDNLRRMQRAQQFISQHLDQADRINECIREIKKLIEDRIQPFLTSVKALISNGNFCEAERKLDSIIAVRRLLGGYCTEEIVRQIDGLYENQGESLLQNVMDRYSNMDFDEYPFNPPKTIFENFEQVKNTNPVYNQASETIRRSIMTKCQGELRKAKEKMPPDPENEHIRTLERAMRYLPETMKNTLESELKYCKGDIAQSIRDYENGLRTTLSTENPTDIRNILPSYQSKQGMNSFFNQGVKLALKQIQDIVSSINQSFDQENIAEALRNVQRLYNYKIKLADIISEVERPYSEIQLRIITIFEDSYRCIMNGFLDHYTLTCGDEEVAAVEKSFICLIEFMKFNDRLGDPKISICILPENFNGKMNNLAENTKNHANKYQNEYIDALKKNDIQSLVNILKAIQKWNPLFTRIRVYYNPNIDKNTLINTIITSLSEFPLYSRMLETISGRIRELSRELINQQLLNRDMTEFSKTRDEFYRKLNEKFSILHNAAILSQFNIQIDINKIEQECLSSLDKKTKEISSEVEKFLERFWHDHHLTRQDYDNFNLRYLHLISIKQEMTVINSNQINDAIQRTERIVFDKIHTWENFIKSEPAVESIATNLINMKRVSNNIPSFKIRTDERIDQVLNEYKSKYGATGFARLGTILNQDATGIGQSLISEQKSFQGYSLSLFNRRT